MKKNIEHLLIIGDELSQRQDHSETHVDTDLQEVSLFDNDDTKTNETKADIINLSTITKPLAWFDYLMDGIFYKMNQLNSSLIFSSEPRPEVNGINLDYYLELYTSGRLTIETNTETPTYTSLSREELNNLAQIKASLSKNKFSQERKDKTLIIEWVGIHDLKRFASGESEDLNTDNLVNKYILHLRELIALGYNNFCIIEPAHTHLTAKNNSKVFLYSVNLQNELSELQRSNPDCRITFIEVQTVFENLGLTIDKNLNLPSEAQQDIASSIIELAIIPNYNFILPEEILLAQFRKAFHNSWQSSKNGHLGFLVEEPGINYLSASLKDIFQHAKEKLRSRTADVLKSLGWINISGLIDKKATCISTQPIIQTTWQTPSDIRSTVENT